jgi:glutamate-1-semialdehyde 2,1-aminomutase
MDYSFPTSHSRRLADRLRRTLPGGDTRKGTFYPPYPLALARGSGCRVWDVDGNEFIDLVNNYAALVHGHAPPAIVEAIVAQARLGTAFPAPSELQAALAERICGRFASIERVRFTNSGTEAVMQAVRVARAFTGREEIVKATGGYHGSWEQVPLSWERPHGRTRPEAAPRARAVRPADADRMAAAIPRAVRGLVHMVGYNDRDALAATMARHGARVAAILLEPVLGSGLIAGEPAYFAAARALADAHGALLICDEIITARLHAGGYQAVLGVRPDLTTLGKVIGGGLPVGAVGGRPEVMDLFDPRRPAYLSHAGTFNGNALTMAAGCASLDLLTPAEIDRINGLGEALAAKLRHTFVACGLPASVTACGSLLQLAVDTQTGGGMDADVSDALFAHVHVAALEHGIYLAPRGFLNLSTAMDEALMARVADALAPAARQAAESIRAMADKVNQERGRSHHPGKPPL